jgi:hypothetical protein
MRQDGEEVARQDEEVAMHVVEARRRGGVEQRCAGLKKEWG